MLSNGKEFGKTAIIFGADMSSSLCMLIIKKDTLILGKIPMQGLDDTILTVKAEYSINFFEHGKQLV